MHYLNSDSSKGESILIVGEFLHDRLGASYERAFTKLGYSVIRFDMPMEIKNLLWIVRNRLGRRLFKNSMFFRRIFSRKLNHSLINSTENALVRKVLIFNGEWVMPETIRVIKQRGCSVIIFHADNPLRPHYNNRPETLDIAKEADIYLVWSERLVNILRGIGIDARFHPFGWDPEACPRVEDTFQVSSWKGISFIGGWDKNREKFLNKLGERFPLRIYGPKYWATRTKSNSKSRTCWQGFAPSLVESATIIRESAICINILRDQHKINGEYDGVIMRHFEVPGAGGFLLSTRSGVATRLFPEGISGAYFSSLTECIVECEKYLSNESLRSSIINSSKKVVAESHTYVHRANEILEMFVKCEKSR